MDKIYQPRVYSDSELVGKSGIYQIRNLVNGKIYIGSSKNLKNRKCHDHLNTLKRNKHQNNHLQNAFNKYGKDNFICTVIQTAENEQELNELEEYWINKCNAVDDRMFYNLKPGGTGGSMPHFICITNEINSKYLHPDTDLTIYLKNGWRLGKPHQSQELIEKRVCGNRGKKRSEETCKNISKALLGKKRKPLSEEQKAYLSSIKKFNNYNNAKSKKVKCINTGEIFNCLGDAARKYNISTCNLSACCHGRKKIAGGMKWEFV